MREKTKTILAKLFPVTGTVRRRVFYLLGGMSIGALLLANLIWFPSAIKEIRQAQSELRRVSVRLIRDQIQARVEENEADLHDTARRFRSYLVESDRGGLRLTAQRLFQSNSAFEEIGILDGKGKEILRLSRRTVITDHDLVDRSTSPLFREGMKQEIHWEPVTITETSEPRVALTARLPGSETSLSGLVYGVINLKSLWNLTREFKLSYEGRVYIVEEKGRLIAAADPSVVLRQISFADRHVIQQLTDPRNSVDGSFVEGNYTNERGVPVTVTGLLLSRPRWGVVIEQPRSVLFSPIRQKIWLFASLSFMGLLISFGLAQMLSRRLTEPVVRLREGAEQIGGGNLEYRVPVETRDEIGELASQFNRMAEQLHASHQAILSALTIPVMGQLSEMQEVLNEAVAKVMAVTEADAASIRLMDDEKEEFAFSVYQGFSKAYGRERPTRVRDEAGAKTIVETLEPLISEDILTDSGGNGNPLAREGFRSVVYLPLKTPKETFGLMTLASREPGRLSSKKADIFRAIAHQISVALENAQLLAARKQAEGLLRTSEETARRLAKENATVAEIGRIISSTLNIEEVYDRFAEEARKLIPFDGISVNMIDHGKDVIWFPYVSGIVVIGHQRGDTLPLTGSVVEEVARTRLGTIIRLDNSSKSKDSHPALSMAYGAGLRSLMVIPLISKDQVIGVIFFRSVQSNIYSDQDLRIGESIASQIAGAISNAQLFAEHERTEEALRLSEQRYRALAESAQDFIFIIDRNGYVQYVNSSGAKEFGCHPEEIIGRNIREPLSPEIIKQQHQNIQKVLESGESLRTDNKVLLPNRELWLNTQIIPLRNEAKDDRANAVFGVSRDITERKHAEEALRKSEAKFQELFDEAPVGYMELDAEEHIIQVNRTELDMFGYTLEEMLGQPIWKFVSEKERETSRQTLMAKLSGSMQPGRDLERTYVRKDGTTFPVLINDSFIRNAEGRITGIRTAVQDITERRRAEEKMAALQEQLRQSQKMESIGRLAGGVAHDFNNLLTVIRGYSQLSLGELQKGDPLWENIEEVRKAADRAADLTRQLLAFSRRQILEFKTVNLNNLIQAMEQMLRRMIGEDIELIIHGGENLGSVKTDPGQMEQVIMNLAVNARDAMPSGGKLMMRTENVYLDEKYVRNHASMKPGYYVKLSISDTGCGMTPETRERAFEPFYTTKEKGKGTGLGLSTVYGIVKQSDGNIWIDSEPGKGTTFNIYLPRMDEPVEVLIKKGELKETPRGNETVLVVEDEEAVRKLAVHTLKKQGYKVLEATGGKEALGVVERHPEPIHLILTDVVMPGMSGPELVEGLRQVRKEFKILFMSGYTDDSVIYHGVREGEMNFIQKPFTVETIGRKVREVLDED